MRPRILCAAISGRANRIRMAANMAITPPSLFGIDRRIAYAQRKYHSGLMWIGVTRGLAGTKFSGSPNRLGVNKEINVRDATRTTNPTVSFIV